MLWQLVLYEIPRWGEVAPVQIMGSFVNMVRCYEFNTILITSLREFQLAETYFSMCVRVL